MALVGRVVPWTVVNRLQELAGSNSKGPYRIDHQMQRCSLTWWAFHGVYFLSVMVPVNIIFPSQFLVYGT